MELIMEAQKHETNIANQTISKMNQGCKREKKKIITTLHISINVQKNKNTKNKIINKKIITKINQCRKKKKKKIITSLNLSIHVQKNRNTNTKIGKESNGKAMGRMHGSHDETRPNLPNRRTPKKLHQRSTKRRNAN